jgi:hypothetical protein
LNEIIAGLFDSCQRFRAFGANARDLGFVLGTATVLHRGLPSTGHVVGQRRGQKGHQSERNDLTQPRCPNEDSIHAVDRIDGIMPDLAKLPQALDAIHA